MNNHLLLRNSARYAVFALGLLGVFGSNVSAAPPFTSTAIEATPPNVSAQGSKPMMMITASKDHTLFGPMFTDFEDLDGDGKIDVTFKPTFAYYGYFDYSKCYSYNTTDKRFVPEENAIATTTTATVNGIEKQFVTYSCPSSHSYWSGNFLNWATTTRLDAVRKMLYGGKRSTDSDVKTVLERANLSKDSHSFVKFYNGPDIRDYTPFSTRDLQKDDPAKTSNPGVYAGLSICNRSDSMGEGGNPVIRLAKGNYRMWGTVEGTVCEWGAGTLGAKQGRYFFDSDKGAGGIRHEASPPNEADDGAKYGSVGPELTARVEVCKSAALLGLERCQLYGSVYKPIGLLQDFGTPQGTSTAARTEFGLISGSYDQNLTAGALRKNVSDFLDEIKPTTGQFCFSSGASCPSTTLADGRSYTTAGAIAALDNILLYGRNGSNYDGSNVQLPSELTNGTLAAWGNPVGEMVVQALQYFAGGTSTNPTTTTNDTAKGIPVATWTDPLSSTNTVRTTRYGKPICRAMNVLALSSSALSFDGDDADAPFATLPNRSRGTLPDYTDAIGAAEGINSTLRSVGSVTGGFGEECSGKTVTTLSKVSGICPEAPGVGGTYKVAGAALYANTNRVRTVTTEPGDLPGWGLKVKTYAASLAGGVARIEVKIPGTGTGTGTSTANPAKYVYITPESLWASNSNAKRMPGAMLTFASVSSSATHGAFMVTWNDSLFGGDYDMDIAGFLRYDIIGSAAPYQLKITTDIVNVGAGWTGSHGFSVIGTKDFDGRYLTHRHLSSDSVISGASHYLCGNASYRGAADLSTVSIAGIPPLTGNGTQACDVSSSWDTVRPAQDSPVSLTFEMVGVAGVTLNDPLWYAAKYGSFTPSVYSDPNQLPDTASKWDVKRNDGAACSGDACSDGEPDGYFLARRPELLERQLRDMLEAIINGTNSAPAVSSAQLVTGNYKYVARFEPNQNSGSLLAYKLGSNGSFSSSSDWDAGVKLKNTSYTDRQVITNDVDSISGNVSGIAFTTTSVFSPAFTTALLGTGVGALTAAQGNELINYVRGDISKEYTNGIWDPRSVSNIMGTIINSTPWLQTRPIARIFGGTPSYGDFVIDNAERTKLLWVGSNDGMLHAFIADGSDAGKPVISYLPSPMVDRLRTVSLDKNAVTAGMDGSPFTGDVIVGSTPAWKTYLFSSMGRGGKSFFALDVTDPANLTEVNATSVFKWMFSSTDDADLGYVLGDQVAHPISGQAVSVVKLNNGKYGVLLPNGLNSTAGKAYLFILLVDGPDANGNWGSTFNTSTSRYIKIPTDSLTANGMMGATWVDLDNNGTADVVYGTDLQGRLWRFSIGDSDPANWKSTYPATGTPVPMFEAMDGTDRLSISTSPTISFPSVGGVIVTFGTGKSLLTGDFPDASKTQRFYGIRDSLDTTRGLPPSDLSTLVSRTLTATSDGNVYVSAGGAINWTTKDGWYINFPTTSSPDNSSEMVLSAAELRGGSVNFTTIRPHTGTDKCFDEPDARLYSLDPTSGMPKSSALGTVTIGGITYSFIGISQLPSGTACTGTGCLVNQKVRYAQDNTDRGNGPEGACPAGSVAMRVEGQSTDLDICFSQGNSRIQWREIPGMRTQ